jgi:cation diffusion facilitator family transporter
MEPFEQLPDAVSSRAAATAGYVRKVTGIGLAANLLLSALKFAAGVVGNSQAVVADAVHSLSDSTTDIAILIGSHYWSSPPDEDHPHGHGRVETLVTTFIGAVILAAGVGIGWEALTTIQERPSAPPGWIAFWAALASVVCKEVLYRWTAAAGRRVKSAALATNAWHHQLDALSSVPVLIAVGAAIVFPSWTFLDHLGAAVVSLIILRASVEIIWTGLREFVDTGASAAVREKILAIASENDSVIQAHAVRTRYVNRNLHVDMHVVVDGSITVLEGHEIAHDIEQSLLQRGPDIADVVVHIEPDGDAVGDGVDLLT